MLNALLYDIEVRKSVMLKQTWSNCQKSYNKNVFSIIH